MASRLVPASTEHKGCSQRLHTCDRYEKTCILLIWTTVTAHGAACCMRPDAPIGCRPGRASKQASRARQGPSPLLHVLLAANGCTLLHQPPQHHIALGYNKSLRTAVTLRHAVPHNPHSKTMINPTPARHGKPYCIGPRPNYLHESLGGQAQSLPRSLPQQACGQWLHRCAPSPAPRGAAPGDARPHVLPPPQQQQDGCGGAVQQPRLRHHPAGSRTRHAQALDRSLLVLKGDRM